LTARSSARTDSVFIGLIYKVAPSVPCLVLFPVLSHAIQA
jgi:hypothetical protein